MMAQKGVLQRDPWKELAARKGNRQVELGEILSCLSVEQRTGETLKKALVQRVTRLTRAQ